MTRHAEVFSFATGAAMELRPILRLGYGQGLESELLSHCLVCGGSPRGTSGDDSGGSGWTTAGSVLRLGYGQGRVLNSFGMTIPASRRLCQCRVSVGG